MPLKALLARLDVAQFAQAHRPVVNVRAASHVTRGPNKTARIQLKRHDGARSEPQSSGPLPSRVTGAKAAASSCDVAG